ncbi:unnamed protein product, partial [Laminaria digitata]
THFSTTASRQVSGVPPGHTSPFTPALYIYTYLPLSSSKKSPKRDCSPKGVETTRSVNASLRTSRNPLGFFCHLSLLSLTACCSPGKKKKRRSMKIEVFCKNNEGNGC